MRRLMLHEWSKRASPERHARSRCACILRNRLQSNHTRRHLMSMELSKNELRKVRSLHQKKFRAETGLFIAEGLKTVEEAMRSGWNVEAVYSTDDAFCAAHSGVKRVSPKEMEQLSAFQTPPGYLAVVQRRNLNAEKWPDQVIALDGVRDPGNAGTILRTADWFGFTHLISSEDGVEWFNPKVVQSTMGSIFRMCTRECHLSDVLSELIAQGYAVIGADMHGEAPQVFEWPAKWVLVMGSESHGIREDVSGLITSHISIPGAGRADSLNVAVATGIILSSVFRVPGR
ncbi:MAG: TrmH family RNA methyltransferase [Flavobacteriales bacterium]